jgi:uncharacterized protein YndB with AHSA1/START domain
MSATAGDSAKVTVFVAVAPSDAFDVFTREIDRWWKTGPKYRLASQRPGRLFFEPRLGGRLFETLEVSTGERTIDVGRVTAWDPPWHIELEWRNANFKPDEKTVVDVIFAPSGDGTLVTVCHSGWSALRDEHPARHGVVGAAFSRMMGMWWGTLMTSFREHIDAR